MITRTLDELFDSIRLMVRGDELVEATLGVENGIKDVTRSAQECMEGSLKLPQERSFAYDGTRTITLVLKTKCQV